MSTKYVVTKSKEKKFQISLKYVLESFPFTPCIFIKKDALGLLILRQFIENWAFPELIPKLIYNLNIILKTHVQGSFKRFSIFFFFILFFF